MSIGISAARPDVADPHRLLAEADFAMYTAKRNGKGCHEMFKPESLLNGSKLDGRTHPAGSAAEAWRLG